MQLYTGCLFHSVFQIKAVSKHSIWKKYCCNLVLEQALEEAQPTIIQGTLLPCKDAETFILKEGHS